MKLIVAIKNIIHNNSLAITGRVNPDKKQSVTVGWRRLDLNGEPVKGYEFRCEHRTPSGNDEYVRRK